jgi:cell division transport system ATP-binding protein
MIASMKAARNTAAVPAAQPAPHADAAASESTPAAHPAATGPRTHPIVLPDVDVAELGVADRLGLSDGRDDEEVGPTS